MKREFYSILLLSSVSAAAICEAGTGIYFENELMQLSEHPKSFATGDLNGDGRPDFVIAHSDFFDHRIALYLTNAEDPDTHVRIPLFLNTTADFIALADYDNDDDLDLFVCDQPLSLLILENDSNAQFTIAQTLTVPGIVHDLRFVHLNNDDFIDLVFTNSIRAGFAINNGGEFSPPVLGDSLVGQSIRWLATGDLDGDNHLELVLGTLDSRIFYTSVLPDFTLSAMQQITTIDDCRGIAVLDLNNDLFDEIILLEDADVGVVLRYAAHPDNVNFQVPPDVPLGQSAYGLMPLSMSVGGEITSLFTIGSRMNYVFPRIGQSFGAPTPISPSLRPFETFGQSVVTDLNNDGKSDIVTAGQDPQLLLLRGCGDGSFDSSPPTSAFGARRFKSGDVNGDGVKDFVIADTNQIRVHLGWNGSFLPPVLLPESGGNRIPKVADVDKDGLPDIVSVGDQGSVRIHFGKPGFAFTISDLDADYPDYNINVEVADIDNDGLNDIILGTDEARVAVRRGLGPRVFASSEIYELNGLHPETVITGLATGDGTADGWTDIFITTASGSARAVMMQNDQSGRFDQLFEYAVGDDAAAPAIADLDHDGAPEFLAVSQSHDLAICFWSDPMVGVRGPQFLTTGFDNNHVPRAVATGNLNGDGFQDIVISRMPSSLDIWMNDSRGRFYLKSSFPLGLPTESTRAFFLVDVSGDGHLDAVMGASDEFGAIVALGDGDGAFTSIVELPDLDIGQLRDGVVIDWDNDGDDEVILLNSRLSIVQFNPTIGGPELVPLTVINELVLALPDYSGFGSTLLAADINHDGSTDLCLAPQSGLGVKIIGISNKGAKTPTLIQSNPINVNFSMFTGGDVNGDGHFDILTIGSDAEGTEHAYTFYGDGSGEFSSVSTSPIGNITTTSVSSMMLRDYDANGHEDLIFISSGNLSMVDGSGDGSFSPRTPVSTPTSLKTFVDDDLDGDGRLDFVALTNPLQGFGNGAEVYFGSAVKGLHVTTIGAISPSGIAPIDVVGDELTDLAVVSFGESRVTVHELTSNRTVGRNKSYAAPYGPTFFDRADLDLDGDEDLMVGSLGTSGAFSANDEYIASILHHKPGIVLGDLDASGSVNGTDLEILLTRWGADGPADFDGDGMVTGADLAYLLSVWGSESAASTFCP